MLSAHLVMRTTWVPLHNLKSLNYFFIVDFRQMSEVTYIALSLYISRSLATPSWHSELLSISLATPTCRFASHHFESETCLTNICLPILHVFSIFKFSIRNSFSFKYALICIRICKRASSMETTNKTFELASISFIRLSVCYFIKVCMHSFKKC